MTKSHPPDDVLFVGKAETGVTTMVLLLSGVVKVTARLGKSIDVS